jgi:hypothetical protein
MVVRTFEVLMEKSSGVMLVILAFRMAPPAVTEVESDGDAENDPRTEVRWFLIRWRLSFLWDLRAPKDKSKPINWRSQKQKKTSSGSELVCCLSRNAVQEY